MAFTSLLSRRGALAGALALTTFGSAGAQQSSINGVYRAEGRNPDGTPYSGTTVIAEQQGTVQISWTVGNQSYAGSGVRQGQIVVLNWGQPDPVIYVVMNDGELHGTWDDGRGLERLTPQ